MKRVYIFTPTYHRFEMTKKSLLSLKWSIESQKENEIKLFIGDNNSPKEMKAWLAMTFSGPNYQVFLSDKNVGKPAIVNYMWEHCDKQCDVVCSFDSDLITVPENQDWIDRCVKVLSEPSIGLVSAEQLEQCCHLKRLLQKEMKVADNKLIYDKFFGVAGGCVFMRKADWNKIGGYRVKALYGGDDAYLMQATNKILKKKVVVNISAPLIHPIDENKGYVKWKAKACGKLRGEVKGPPITKGYWDE